MIAIERGIPYKVDHLLKVVDLIIAHIQKLHFAIPDFCSIFAA